MLECIQDQTKELQSASQHEHARDQKESVSFPRTNLKRQGSQELDSKPRVDSQFNDLRD